MVSLAPVGNVAFVLGGGGILGAHEVGMLRALAESSVEPDVILGTSVRAMRLKRSWPDESL